jgi:hypothetical protein
MGCAAKETIIKMFITELKARKQVPGIMVFQTLPPAASG